MSSVKIMICSASGASIYIENNFYVFCVHVKIDLRLLRMHETFTKTKKRREEAKKKAKLPLHYAELNKQLNMNGIFEMPTRTLLK